MAGPALVPEHPDLALLIFRELDGRGPATDRELKIVLDRNTYEWVREIVKRYRHKDDALRRIRSALDRLDELR